MDLEIIDYERLRRDLIDYFGSAMFSGMPMAIVDLSDVEMASYEELLMIAQRNSFDLREYQISENNNFKL